MNNLRRYFVVPAAVLCCFIAFIAIGHLSQRFVAGWLGTLLAASSYLLVMTYLLLARVARTSRYLPVPLAITVLGVGLSVYSAVNSGELVALYWSLVATSVFLLYVFWYSNLGQRQSSVLKLAENLPEFALETLEGESVSSSRFRGRATLLLFFRGNWCPLCMAQIREIAERYKELEKLGIRIVLISPQSQRHSASLAQRFSVPMEFYRDADGSAARALEIFHQSGVPAGMEALGYEADTVMPTLVLTNANGKVLFLDQTDNYRLRPDPEVFIAIAKRV